MTHLCGQLGTGREFRMGYLCGIHYKHVRDAAFERDYIKDASAYPDVCPECKAQSEAKKPDAE